MKTILYLFLEKVELPLKLVVYIPYYGYFVVIDFNLRGLFFNYALELRASSAYLAIRLDQGLVIGKDGVAIFLYYMQEGSRRIAFNQRRGG
jgi:hypothetical protein